MTASTVSEAVEPLSMWKQLFSYVHSELQSNARILEAVPMVRFVITTFRTQDEEVEDVHLPLIFAGLVEYLKVCIVGPFRWSKH